MTKQITPEVIEEAINWLEVETYCCYALACALSGEKFDSLRTTGKQIRQAEDFLHPLLFRDEISSSGTWTNAFTAELLNFSRETWLRKIAQELREGKISA